MASDRPRPGGAVERPDGVNLKQAARRLGLHYMTVYRYVRQGQLEAYRVGGAWFVPEAALAGLVAQQLAPPAGPGLVAPARAVDWSGRLYRCLLGGDESSAWRVVRAALAAGRSVPFCYSDMVSGALVRLGAEWEAGEITVADQYVATAVAARIVARLGALSRRPGRDRGTVVFGAPTGELHALPVSIAADLVRGAGFAVLELGADAPPEAFVLAAQRAPRLVAVGIGLTSSQRLSSAQEVVDAVRAMGTYIPILIGGQAAISAASSGLRGVTAWAPDGPSAVALIERFAACRPVSPSSRGRGTPGRAGPTATGRAAAWEPL